MRVQPSNVTPPPHTVNTRSAIEFRRKGEIEAWREWHGDRQAENAELAAFAVPQVNSLCPQKQLAQDCLAISRTSPIRENMTCGRGRESRRGDWGRISRIGERRGAGGARVPRDRAGITTAARRARRLVRGPCHGAIGRRVPARQHGLLHESRSLPRHGRRRSFPRSTTEAPLHHARSPAKRVQSREMARALPPRTARCSARTTSHRSRSSGSPGECSHSYARNRTTTRRSSIGFSYTGRRAARSTASGAWCW